MHIHIHSQTQRCTIQRSWSKSSVGSFTVGYESGWQTPTNLRREVDGRTNGSGIDRFRAEELLDYRRKERNKKEEEQTKTDAVMRGEGAIRSCGHSREENEITPQLDSGPRLRPSHQHLLIEEERKIALNCVRERHVTSRDVTAYSIAEST